MTTVRFHFANDVMPGDLPLPAKTMNTGAADSSWSYLPLFSGDMSAHSTHSGETSTGGINEPGPNPNMHSLGVSYPVLPVGSMTGSFTYTTRVQLYVGAAPYMTMTVRSGDGLTVRGTLFDGQLQGFASGSTDNTVHEYTQTITPVTIQSGDRLVVERGIKFSEVGSYTKLGYYYDKHDATNGVYTSGDVGTTNTKAGWLDLTLNSAGFDSKVRLGANTVAKAYLGSTQVAKVYLGTNQVL